MTQKVNDQSFIQNKEKNEKLVGCNSKHSQEVMMMMMMMMMMVDGDDDADDHTFCRAACNTDCAEMVRSLQCCNHAARCGAAPP